MDTAVYNDWQLVSLSHLPAWTLALLCALILAAAVLSLRGLSREKQPFRRRTLIVLRLLSALCLTALLFEPGIRLLQTRRARNAVAVLLDLSSSMALPAEGGISRAEALRRRLSESSALWEKLSQRFRLDFYGFGESAERLPSGTVPQDGDFQSGATDILGALRRAADESGSHQGAGGLSGILLLSDGADNTSLGASLDSQGRSDIEALGIPISAIHVGGAAPRDLAVERISADDFAFVRSPVTVTAFIRASGFGPRTIPVTLRMDGQPFATRMLQIDGDGLFPVEFTFSPDQTGRFACTVDVPMQVGEAVEWNNARSFPFKVIRDRIRVLHVAGWPSWDMRFLRARLKGDPNIDLVSSYILRDASDDPRTVLDSELSLIPFPMQEIFHDQIHTFDVIVIQNFSHEEHAYSMSRYFGDIASYVRGGGALVMVGGENSFGEGHYEKTDLGPLLPVVVTGRPPVTDSFQARLTDEGRTHPIMRMSSGDSTAAWRGLPLTAGAHVTKVRPGAQALLDHPFETAGGRNIPIIAVGEADKGRVMAILTDATWQWAFSAGGQTQGARLYDRFWSRALRWLIRDPELTPVRMTLDKSALSLGERLSVQVEARRSDYSVAGGAQVRLTLTRLPASDENGAQQWTAEAGEDGTAHFDIAPEAAGAYRIEAAAYESGKVIGSDRNAIAVRFGGGEQGDLADRPRLLKEITLVSGGRFFSTGDRLDEFPLTEPALVEIGGRKEEPLPGMPLVFALMALSLFTEWLLSRRWGYP